MAVSNNIRGLVITGAVIVRRCLQAFLVVCVLVSQAQIDMRVAAEFLKSFNLALQCWADSSRLGNIETSRFMNRHPQGMEAWLRPASIRRLNRTAQSVLDAVGKATV